MKLGREELNWMKKQVQGINGGFVDSDKLTFGDGVARATKETLDIINRLESSLADETPKKKRTQVKTLIGNGPIILEENVNEFLDSGDYDEIIDIDWTQIEYERDNMVIFYANVTYTELIVNGSDEIAREVNIKPKDQPNKELAFNMSVYAPVEDGYVEDKIHDELLTILEHNGYAGQVYEIREQDL